MDTDAAVETCADLPVHPIDLAPFRHGDAAARGTVAEQVDAACRDTGFLLLTGHGVPRELQVRLLDSYAEFFDLPVDEKLRCLDDAPGDNRGYTPLGGEALAYSRGEASPPDLFEALTVGRQDAAGAYYDEHRSFFAPNAWPERPAELADVWREHEREMARVSGDVLTAMAIALDLPEDWLVVRARRSVITTRAINYERPAGAPPPTAGQLRLGAHTDYGIATLLLADDVPGLQVWRAGRWHDVEIPPGAIVCNIGDMLERWTNDQWTSTLHRVVPPPPGADGPVRRRSVARFLDGEPDMVVECIPSCCSAERPPLYPPVVAGEWLRAKIVGSVTQQEAVLPQPAGSTTC
jgi:isopenicillin N synthase-like dioxygenase